MPEGLEPTYSTADVEALLPRDDDGQPLRGQVWIRTVSRRDGIGQMSGRERRYTRRDVARLRRLVDPEETRGAPRGARV